MKIYKIETLILVILFNFSSNCIIAQSKKYKTHKYKTSYTKKCGSCGKPVSVYSSIGMICPHCKVRWGEEHTTNSTNYDNSFENSSNNTFEYSQTKCSCGRKKNAYAMMCKKCSKKYQTPIPKFNTPILHYPKF